MTQSSDDMIRRNERMRRSRLSHTTPRTKPQDSPALWVALVALLVCSPAARAADVNTKSEPSGEEFALPVDERMAADIDRLIADLGSPSYAARTEATDGLIEIGAPAFARLREAYRGTDDLEARLRMERIVFASYLDHHVYSRHAFLGISLRAYTPRDGDDIELPRGTRGVSITNVIADTAAQRAGLLRNDVIIAADGNPLRGTTDIVTSFSQTIAARPPGAHMLLTIARSVGIKQTGVKKTDRKKTLVKEIDVTLGRCPRERVQQTRIREKYNTATEQFRIWWKRFFVAQPASRVTTGDHGSDASNAGDR